MSKAVEADATPTTILAYSVGNKTGNIFFTLSRGTKTWNEDANLLCNQDYFLYLNWKHAFCHGPPFHASTSLDKSPLSPPALPTMTINFINGHIMHGDFDAALSVLYSEEFVSCSIPPFVFAAFVNDGILKVEDGVLLNALTSFLIRSLNDGRISADTVMSKGNIIKSQDDNFWCAFESLRSIVTLRRTKLIILLNSLISMSDDLIGELLQKASDDRYHGFKYICRSVIALYKAATTPSEKEDVCQIISNLTVKASQSSVYYVDFMAELFDALSDESLSILFSLLMSLSEAPRIYLLFQILEKKCHLCLDPHVAAAMPTSDRILALLSSLKDKISDSPKGKMDSLPDMPMVRMLLLSWRSSIIMSKRNFRLLSNDAILVEEAVLSKIKKAIHEILHITNLSPLGKSILTTITDAYFYRLD